MDDLVDGAPENTVTEETRGGSDEKHRPWRELVTYVTWKQPQVFTQITSDAEDRDLLLVEPQNRFESGGVQRERRTGSSSYLDPRGGC